VLEILLVDDVAQDLKLLERTIRQCKILNPIKQLASGEDLLSSFHKNPGERYLVFIDLIMEPISGLETLRRANNLGLTSHSIFILLSGMNDLKRIKEGYQLGARTFVMKPLRCEDIREIFHALKTVFSSRSMPDGEILEWINPPLRKSPVSQITLSAHA
jgi:CheY-like chemotaxis protein